MHGVDSMGEIVEGMLITACGLDGLHAFGRVEIAYLLVSLTHRKLRI